MIERLMVTLTAILALTAPLLSQEKEENQPTTVGLTVEEVRFRKELRSALNNKPQAQKRTILRLRKNRNELPLPSKPGTQLRTLITGSAAMLNAAWLGAALGTKNIPISRHDKFWPKGTNGSLTGESLGINDKVEHAYWGSVGLYWPLRLAGFKKWEALTLTTAFALANEGKDAFLPAKRYGWIGGEGFSGWDLFHTAITGGMLLGYGPEVIYESLAGKPQKPRKKRTFITYPTKNGIRVSVKF